MLKTFLLSLMIGWLGLCGAIAIAQPESAAPINLTPQANSMYVVQDHRWAPLAFRNQQGNPDGLIIDIWRLLGKKMQRPVEFELLDWQHTLQKVRDSRSHIHGGLLQSEERATYLDFSNSLFQLRGAIFIDNKKLANALDITDLGTVQVGVTAGGYEEEFLTAHHPDLQLRLYNNNEQLVEAATRGDISAFIADYPVGMYYLDRLTTPDKFRVLNVLYSRSVHAAVARGNKAALKNINDALAQITPEEMTALTQKWINREEVRIIPWGLILLLGGGLCITVIGALLYHNKTLTRKITAQHAALKERQQQVDLLTSNMTDWVWTVNEQNCFSYVSPSVTKLLGYAPEELLNQNMSIVLHPNDHERAHAQYAHVLAAARRGEYSGYRDSIARFDLQHKNGQMICTEAALRTFFTPVGEFSGAQGCSRDIGERKQAEDVIRQMAFNDPLTQLPNRRLLTDRIQQAMAGCNRHHQYCALLFIDLDNFKYVNDNYGHDNGDLLLQQIAQRLSSGIRDSDTLARFGGDEFVVVSEQLSQELETAKHQALLIGIKMLELFDRDFLLRDARCHVTSSVGIALFNDDSRSVASLLKQADVAMYQAKANGRNRCVVSDAPSSLK
ncbi:MAG: diguanylate cyclase [Cellvibrio sp.]|uniref:diguanylate cyclase domain-containing protein n=1 Tax=Cellvibrio sp. TaxID=1965322 RepID=UPI0027168326|nr:diguanylate cyclase [Cellvibrio sp.]